MKEETKDKIEAGGAWILESIASAVPVIGTPLALAINKTIAAGDARRVQIQIADLSRLLEEAIEDGRIGLASLETDEFLANLHFVIRQLQETNESEKRARLQHALVTGAESKWVSQAERFTRIVARLEEPHIQALAAFNEIAEGTPRRVRHGLVLVLKKLSEAGFQRSENYYRVIFEQLAAESLIVIGSPAELAAQMQRSRERNGGDGQPNVSPGQEQEGSTLKMTGLGLNFLTFLRKRDPA